MNEVDPFLAWIKNKSFDDLESYPQRGRKFEGASLSELNALWITAYRARLNANFDSIVGQEASDIEAELRLRNADPPFEEVLADFQEFQKRAKKALELLESDPKRRKLVNDAILRDLEEFISQLDRKTTN